MSKEFRGNRQNNRPIDETADINVDEIVEEINHPEPVRLIGIVSEDTKLNIREKPDIKSGILCVVDPLSELLIDQDGSVDDWYKVCTGIGVEGYCMKQFVRVKREG